MIKATKNNRHPGTELSGLNTFLVTDNSARQTSLNIGEILRRQKWLIAACISQGIALGVLYWIYTPEKFESRARIMVSERTPQLSSGADGSAPADIVDEDVLANHMEVIRSRRIIEQALERHQLAELPSLTRHVRQDTDAVDHIIENLKLTRGGAGSAKSARILSVSFVHDDAENARRILNAIVIEYQMFLNTQLSNAMAEANAIIREAQSNLEKALEEAQQKYVSVREKAPVLFQGEGSANVFAEQYKMLHKELLELDILQSGVQLRLQKAKEVYDGRPDGKELDLEALGVIDLDSLQRLGVFAGLQTSGAQSAEFIASQPERLEEARTQYSYLLSLKAEEQRLSADFGENHPQVRKLREQIALTEQFVNERRGEEGGPATPDKSLTPGRLLKAYIGFLENDLAAFERRREELKTRLTDAEQQARTLVEFELQEGILKSRVDRTQQLFDGLVEQLRELDMVSGMRGFIHEVLESPRTGEKVWPRLSICGAAGLIFGIVAGLILGGLNDQLDGRFRSSDEIDSLIDLNVLGRVGRLRISKGGSVILSDSEPESESFRILRTIMLNDIREGKIRLLSGTSPIPGDGKSTIMANLAASFAKLELRVLYLEADMRRPNAHVRFNVPEELGLADVLLGKITIDQAIKASDVPTLSLITAGAGTLNPAELLQSVEYDQLLESLRSRFDLVVVDVGPVLAVADPLIVSQKADATVLIIRSASDTRQQVQETVSMLRSAGANLIGCIVNTVGSGNEFERVGYYGYYGEAYRDPSIVNGSAASPEKGSSNRGALT